MELSCQKALRCLGVFCVKVPSDSLTPPCHAKLPGSASLSRDVQDAPHPAHWGSHYPALLQWLPAPRQFPAWLGSPGNPAPSPIPHLPQPGQVQGGTSQIGRPPPPPTHSTSAAKLVPLSSWHLGLGVQVVRHLPSFLMQGIQKRGVRPQQTQ